MFYPPARMIGPEAPERRVSFGFCFRFGFFDRTANDLGLGYMPYPCKPPESEYCVFIQRKAGSVFHYCHTISMRHKYEEIKLFSTISQQVFNWQGDSMDVDSALMQTVRGRTRLEGNIIWMAMFCLHLV